jgi:prevent-host-death family protein
MQPSAEHIGIRELKARATEIVRQVRDERAEYVITNRGKPVALIVPLSEPDAVDPAFSARLFADIDALAAEIASRWPAGVGAAEAVREARRDL